MARTFHIFIPSKNQFLVGPANLERPSSKPIENLRPQHLLDAIFWQPIPKDAPYSDRGNDGAASELLRADVWWLERMAAAQTANGRRSGLGDRAQDLVRPQDLSIVRIDTFELGRKARLRSCDTAGWDMFGTGRYPRQISLDRPQNDYQLQITITKLTANEAITPDRFELPQPAGNGAGSRGRRSRRSHKP